MGLFRRDKTPPPPPPERIPHPDGRIEAELQRVLALQRSAQRVESRLEAIHARVEDLEATAARKMSGSPSAAHDLLSMRPMLQAEARALEESLPALHDEIAKRLAGLGDDAVML
jgi:DNA topoisomerase VI subunit B